MLVPFVKMHGCGNDFVVFDARSLALGITPARAAAIADRHFGIGCDQVIVLERSPSHAAAFMRIHNADGGEAGACGNAARCVASLLRERSASPEIAIETASGVLTATGAAGQGVEIDMGQPRLGWRDVPVAGACDTLRLDLSCGPVDAPAALSMGNPHATFFVANLDAIPVARLGAALERHPLFPQGVNVGFAEIRGRTEIRLRVWERGAGLTLACGSGACAALVNAARRGLAEREAVVHADGGALHITWRDDGHVLMGGPVATVFQGMLDLSALPQ